MATDGIQFGAPVRLPRPLLFVLLGGLLAVILLMRLGGSDGSEQPAANPPATAQKKDAGGKAADPETLDVKLEALASERPAPAATDRNPFRFKAKPAPPAPAPVMKSAGRADGGSPGPPPPPPVPPITVKFIGTWELPQGGMVAIFTDCTVGRRSVPVREGGTILGQYRLVKIGLQSVVVEHLDGRGRTTLPKTGQECVK